MPLTMREWMDPLRACPIGYTGSCIFKWAVVGVAWPESSTLIVVFEARTMVGETIDLRFGVVSG